MKSLSEIETTSKRASRAIGFSWGISEEVGKCIRLLELFSFPGIKNLNQYYQLKSKENFEKLTLIKSINEAAKLSFCPIILGVSFLDQVKSIEIQNICTSKRISYRILFLPFLSRSSVLIGKRILLKLDDYDFLLNLNVNISSNFSKTFFLPIAEKVEVSFLDNEDSFTDIEWKNLYKLSENTFVEESDSLKQGAAGAGLTDND
jgi:hypothetical protein